MTKIRGAKALLDELRHARNTVRDAGRSNLDYSTVIRLTEDTGRDLLGVADDLSRLLDILEPMLERVERRATPEYLEELEQRLIKLEQQVAQLVLDRRGIVPLHLRKQGGG